MIRSIKLWQFFIGCGVLLLVSFLCLMVIVIQARTATIHLAAQECEGLRYQAAISPVLKAVLAARSQRFTPESLTQLRQAVAALNAATAHHDLTVFPDGKALSALNTTSKAFLDQQTPAGYQSVVDTSLALWQRVGETSQLVIDPDIDLYYLIDVVLRQLPYTATVLDRYIAISEEAITEHRIGPEAQVELMMLHRMLSSGLSETEQALRSAGDSMAGRRLATSQALKPSLEGYATGMRAYLDLVQSGSASGRMDLNAAAHQRAAETTVTRLFQLLETSHALLDRAVNARAADLRRQLVGMVVIGVTLVAVPLVFSAIVLARLRQRIERMMSMANQIAEGNLTIQLADQGPDELGLLARSLNQMTHRLADMVLDVSHSALELGDTCQAMSDVSDDAARVTDTIAKRIHQLAEANLDQSRHVSEGSALTQGMNEVAASIAENARQVAEAAAGSADAARHGKDVLEAAVTKVMALHGTVQTSSVAVMELGNCGEKIGGIVAIIQAIAAQTNLLALNAAIEAARAGEQGRGFAVVADEVRKLAKDSANSAQQIYGMISEIQAGTTNAVAVMRRGTAEAAQGVALIQEASAAIDNIVQSVSTTDFEVESMSYAMVQLSDNLRQTADGMLSMATVSEESAAVAEEVSATTEVQSDRIEAVANSSFLLANKARHLQELMAQFKTTGEWVAYTPVPHHQLPELPDGHPDQNAIVKEGDPMRQAIVLMSTLLVLGTAATAHAEPAPSPAPVAAAPAAAAPAAPPITFDGYLDSYFSYRFGSTGRTDNVLRIYDTQNGSFVPSYARIGIGMMPGPVGFRADFAFGPTADITNFDTDPKNPDQSAVSEVFKHINQAYITWKLPTSVPLVLDIGRFNTTAGAEVVDSKDNWNYSRSLLFGYGPFTHTGARLTAPFSDSFSLQASVVNGWDWVQDNNMAKSFGLSGTYVTPVGTSLTLTTYQGAENAKGDVWRQYYDFVAAQDFGTRVHAKVNGSYGVEGPGSWYGVAGYAKVDILTNLYLAARVEGFNDPNGIRLGLKDTAATPQPLGVNIISGTLTAGVPVDKLEFRAEIRHDQASAPVYDGGKSNSQTTLQMAAMAKF